MLATMRRLITVALVTGAVLIGLVAQAGSYLLASPDPEGTLRADPTSTTTYADVGPHSVGVRKLGEDEAPVQMTYWYPGIDDPARSSTSYSYAINMFGPETTTLLASYGGIAKRGLVPDLGDGPYPIVVLSHGFAISPSSYGWLAEHLASWGFVVLAPHHRESLDPGALWRSSIDRLRDIEATLDFAESVGGELGDMVDTASVAVVGHSYGGYAALAAAGARIDPEGFDASCDAAYRVDDPLVFLCDALLPRLGDMAGLAGIPPGSPDLWPNLIDHPVEAVISMAGDAAMFDHAGLAEVSAPVMSIGGTADTDAPFEWGTRLTYDHVSSTRRVEIALEGAGHMVFTGECEYPRRLLGLAPTYFCSDESWDRVQVHKVVRGYATAFLRVELMGDASAVTELEPEGLPSGVGYRSEGY